MNVRIGIMTLQPSSGDFFFLLQAREVQRASSRLLAEMALATVGQAETFSALADGAEKSIS